MAAFVASIISIIMMAVMAILIFSTRFRLAVLSRKGSNKPSSAELYWVLRTQANQQYTKPSVGTGKHRKESPEFGAAGLLFSLLLPLDEDHILLAKPSLRLDLLHIQMHLAQAVEL